MARAVSGQVAALAAERVLPVTLELGGKDAAIVLDDADLSRAAEGIVWGGSLNAGQACLAIERVYVHDAVERCGTWGRNVLADTLAGDELRTMMAGLRRLSKHDPVSRSKLHGEIAEAVVAAEGYTVG